MKMLKALQIWATIFILSMKLAMAANYTVGGSNGGWDQATDIATWASSITFLAGDNLIFQYTTNHDVTEVSKADYDSCTAANSLQPPHTGGLTVIPLTAAGRRYFICGTAGHCMGGMKLEIATLAASVPPPSATPSLQPPPTTTPSAAPPTPSARRPVSSPPPKSMAPKESPPLSKAAAGGPTSSPASASPPTASLVPPPPPSSAARFNVISALVIACSGFLMIGFLNL